MSTTPNEAAIGAADNPAAADDRPTTADPRRWRALAVLALVQFMLVLDNTVVNVALPSVQKDLAFSPAGWRGWSMVT